MGTVMRPPCRLWLQGSSGLTEDANAMCAMLLPTTTNIDTGVGPTCAGRAGIRDSGCDGRAAVPKSAAYTLLLVMTWPSRDRDHFHWCMRA